MVPSRFGATAPESSSATLASVQAALPMTTSITTALGTDARSAEPADQRGVGDQEQPGFAQQRFGQIEERRQRAGIERHHDGGYAAEGGIGKQGAAQQLGRMDHDSVSSGLGWCGQRNRDRS